jgi:hypothetical protein
MDAFQIKANGEMHGEVQLPFEPAQAPSKYEASISFHAPGLSEPIFCAMVKFDLGLGGPVKLPSGVKKEL